MKERIAKFSVFILIIILTACSNEKENLLKRMFDLESRGKVGASPQRIEELREAIEESYERVEKVIAESERLASFWRLLAFRYAEKGMFGEALSAVQRALMYNPNDPGIYYILGVSAGNLAKTSIIDPGQGMRQRENYLLFERIFPIFLRYQRDNRPYLYQWQQFFLRFDYYR